MTNRIITSALTIVCVLCGGWVSGAFAAPSVRALGGAGTYTGTTSAAAAKTGGTATTSARAGSVRVTPAVKVSSSTTPRTSNAGTKASASDDQRMSIGKYLGPSVTGGTKVSGAGTTADDPHRNWELQLDAALIEAKAYTDTALETAEGYTDDAIDGLTTLIETDYLTKSQADDLYQSKTDLVNYVTTQALENKGYLTADSLSSLGYATSDALSDLSAQVANNKSALEKLNGDKTQTGSVRQIASDEADAAVAAAAQYTNEKISGITSMPSIPTVQGGQYYVLDTTGAKPAWHSIEMKKEWVD